MPHEKQPQEDLRLFDPAAEDHEIYVPPMPHVGAVESEPVAPPPAESDLPAKSRVPTAAQQEQIDKYLDQFSPPQAYEMVMGTTFEEAPEGAPASPSPTRGGNSEVHHETRRQKPRVFRRTMFGDIGAGRKIGEREALEDSRRAENTENSAH